MRYTSRKFAGILIIVLAIIIIARFIPLWMWYGVSIVLLAGVLYFLYIYLN